MHEYTAKKNLAIKKTMVELPIISLMPIINFDNLYDSDYDLKTNVRS